RTVTGQRLGGVLKEHVTDQLEIAYAAVQPPGVGPQLRSVRAVDGERVVELNHRVAGDDGLGGSSGRINVAEPLLGVRHGGEHKHEGCEQATAYHQNERSPEPPTGASVWAPVTSQVRNCPSARKLDPVLTRPASWRVNGVLVERLSLRTS